jgi:mRNA interferase HigB
MDTTNKTLVSASPYYKRFVNIQATASEKDNKETLKCCFCKCYNFHRFIILGMHVISKVKLREFWVQHADSQDALNDWYKFASKSDWSNLLDVQKKYPKAEAVGNFTVFNIKGNNYRLIVDIRYSSQTIYIKYILTHTEYDKETWKDDPYF